MVKCAPIFKDGNYEKSAAYKDILVVQSLFNKSSLFENSQLIAASNNSSSSSSSYEQSDSLIYNASTIIIATVNATFSNGYTFKQNEEKINSLK
jgi:hypothetical protein